MSDERIAELEQQVKDHERDISDLYAYEEKLHKKLHDSEEAYKTAKAWADDYRSKYHGEQRRRGEFEDKYNITYGQLQDAYRRINYLESLLRRLPVVPDPWEDPSDV